MDAMHGQCYIDVLYLSKHRGPLRFWDLSQAFEISTLLFEQPIRSQTNSRSTVAAPASSMTLILAPPHWSPI